MNERKEIWNEVVKKKEIDWIWVNESNRWVLRRWRLCSDFSLSSQSEWLLVCNRHIYLFIYPFSCSIQFVIVIAIAGALSQLAFIRRLELEEPFTTTRSLLPRSYNTYWNNNNNDKEAQILRLGYVKPEVLSWSPRIILLHNFLSYEECDYLRGVALPRLKISTVVDATTGKGIKSDVRTSSGMFLSHEERKYPMIHAIEKRISVYSQIPIENGELMQVLRYEKNQYYRPHHDYFSDTVSYSLLFSIHSFIIIEDPTITSIACLTVQFEAWWPANSYNAYVFRWQCWGRGNTFSIGKLRKLSFSHV